MFAIAPKNKIKLNKTIFYIDLLKTKYLFVWFIYMTFRHIQLHCQYHKGRLSFRKISIRTLIYNVSKFGNFS